VQRCRCRGAGAERRFCRSGAEVQRFKRGGAGAEVQRCRGDEYVRLCRSGAEQR
jgi:hypothetical protein